MARMQIHTAVCDYCNSNGIKKAYIQIIKKSSSMPAAS